METKQTKKDKMAVQIPIDGSAINFPVEENLPEIYSEEKEETVELDLDIMMYMFNI